jgi:poly-gamma-glutamate capsule biosynthesis protein CapA/YwtB (metallophosphatase superfamily)
MRIVALLCAGCLLAGCAGAPSRQAPEPVVDTPPESAPAPPANPPAPSPRPIDIAAVGDIMLGTTYPEDGYDRLPPDDAAGTFADTASILRAADIAFGNLEGVMRDGGEPFKVCKNPAFCYLFRMPARYVQHLADAGFDVVSLANNHARDFGEDGRAESMRILDEAGIRHSGREGDIATWRVKDSRVALVAFAPNPGAHSLLDIPAAASLVAALAAEHDVVIVSFHGGAEGPDSLHIAEGMELFHDEERGDLIAFSHAVVDAGADLVLGHGPHVPRALEVYRERLIAYSLGNFATALGISIEGDKGLAPILLVTIGGEGRFVDGRVVSTRQVRPIGPRLDPSGEAFELMRRLSAQDRGDAAPAFFGDGRFAPAR